jgi:alcohol dehydrogenase
LWLEQGSLSLREIAKPDRPGDCLVRVTMAGICGTDLQMVRGYADFIGVPGHEFVGIVDAVSRADDRHWIGQRVVGDINIGCGECAACRRAVKEHCEHRDVLGIRLRHGAFAEFLTLPAINLHPVPDSVSDQTAVFTEPVAAGCRILEQIDLGPNQRVVVLGDGRMGLLVAQVLKTTGAEVTLFGTHDDRMGIARALGLNVRSTPTGPLARADRVDVAVDVTGRADGLQRALDCLRPQGTLILKTTVHDASAMTTWPIVVDEITIIGSRCGPFRPALKMLEEGTVRVDPLVTRVTGLDDYERAFREAASGLKVMFAL